MASILLLFLIAKPAASLSGCEVCASNGQCNAAFHNGPGKYCGSFYDISTSGNKPCCCPMQATCKVSPTQCMCHVSKPQPSAPSHYYPPPPPQRHSTSHTNSYYDGYQTTGLAQKLASFIAIIAVLVSCCCCVACIGLCNEDGGHHRQDLSPHRVPVATAVPAPNKLFNYGSTAYGQPSSDGGGGAGTAIASGLGGFAAGTILSNLMSQNHHAQVSSTPQVAPRYQDGYFFGDSGGGYDIAGDTGGDGYDVAGDSGDGGYDIAGDSGDWG